MAEVVHISEDEATRHFVALLERASQGEKIRVERDGRPDVMIVADEPVQARSITAIIEGLKEREAAQGLATIDEDFAADVADARKRYNASPDNPVVIRRTISEAREMLRRLEETEDLAIPDPDFAADMEQIHAMYNQPMEMSRWD